MTDLNTQAFIERQNEAYFFQTKKHVETEVAKALSVVEDRLQEFEAVVSKTNKNNKIECNAYTDSAISTLVHPCLASDSVSVKDSDYPVGTILSVTLICSETEGRELFLDNAPTVNAEMNNIYLRSDNNPKAQQIFHWNHGKQIDSPAYSKLPGEWRSRGMCGSYNGNVVSCKYFLAQRVK
jgi:hypothetical protein